MPLAASQTRAVPSSLAVTTRAPSGLKAAETTESVWPRRSASSLPLAASQMRAVPSRLAVTTRVPSGLKAAEATQPLWPRRSVSSSPLAASQMRAVPSWLAVTTRVPSGLKAAEATASVWPRRSAQLFAAGGVPDAGGSVAAGGDDAGAVGAEGGRVNRVGVAAEDAPALCRWRRPRRGRFGLAGGDDAGAVGAEGGRIDHGRLWPSRRRQLFAAGGVPDAGGPVEPAVTTRVPSGLKAARIDPVGVAARRASSSPLAASQMRAVPSKLAVTTRAPSGLKAARIDRRSWPRRTRQLFAAGGVPDAGGSVVAGGDDAGAVGAEGGRVDRAGVAAEERAAPRRWRRPRCGRCRRRGGDDAACRRG